MSLSILRLPQVKTKIGLSRSSIYAAVAGKTFPAPIRLGARAVGWLESELDEWLASQIERSRHDREPRPFD